MQIPLPCKGKSFRVLVGVRAAKPADLSVHVYDPNRPNTVYIRRRIPFEEDLWDNANNGKRSFSLPFPRSPELLMLELFDRDSGHDQDFELEKLKIHALEPDKIWAKPEVHRFAEFAQWFAENAGHLKPHFYSPPTDEFLIEYVDEIRDQFGQSLRTPARINRVTGRIQVSAKHFRSYTVPVRLFILLHECYHRVLNTRRERPPDREALRYYLGLGYPGTEALYATTKVFLHQSGPIAKEQYDRVKAIHDFASAYQKAGKENQLISKA